MFGFVIGTVCLIALAKVLRRTYGHGWGHGCGPCGAGYDGSHRFGRHGHGGGFGRRWMLRWLFERLETMPGQERVILQALDRLSENRTLVRDELRQTRADIARAVEGGLIDDSTLEETFARHDRLQAQLRVVGVEALKTVTEALDERQRKVLADILSRGAAFFPRGPGWGGPFRAWA